MKKTILGISLSVLIIGSAVNSFAQQSTKKGDKARKNVGEAQEELMEAKKDSIEDLDKFKIDSNKQIADNKEKISKLKIRKTKESVEDKEKYDKKIIALEEKNDALKKRVDEYNEKDKSKWSSFKREFKYDMDELGTAIKNVGIDNKK